MPSKLVSATASTESEATIELAVSPSAAAYTRVVNRQMIRLIVPALTAAALSGCAGGVPSGGAGQPAAPPSST